MVVRCFDCNIHVDASEIADYATDRPDDPVENRKYSLLKCPQCQSPILTSQKLVIEFNAFEFDLPQQLYPSHSFNINPDIPDDLRNVLNEAIACFQARTFMACAIMCRKVIEVFAIAQKSKKKNLNQSVIDLHNRNILNDQLFEWANELKLSGNSAAHDVNPDITSKDAQDLLDFTIAILDFTYTFQNKFKEFNNRKNNKPTQP